MNNPVSPGLGINLVESIGNWLRGVGQRAGFVPLSWDHDKRPGLIWRTPDPGIMGASILSNVQGVLIREFERAVVLHNGVFYAELESGVYDVRKVPIRDAIEVIWVSTQMTQHKWGVGRVINSENITIGAHGILFLEVTNAREFVLRVVAGNRKYTQQDLEDWVFSIVSSLMRTQIAATTIRDLMQGQEEFTRACKIRLAEAFAEWGIELRNLVINQFDIPQEYRDTIAQVTMAKYQRDTTITAAEAEAEALRIRSRAEAEARLTTGSADVEILARMQAFGLDPIRLKAIEALTQYAQLAATTGGGGDSGTDMVKMMMFMQMSRLLTDPGMPNEAKDALRAQFPVEAARIPQIEAPRPPEPGEPPAVEQQAAPAAPPAEPPAAETPAVQRARIQQTLDNLDERLAAGEISESTYDRLRAKWEQKLAELDS